MLSIRWMETQLSLQLCTAMYKNLPMVNWVMVSSAKVVKTCTREKKKAAENGLKSLQGSRLTVVVTLFRPNIFKAKHV